MAIACACSGRWCSRVPAGSSASGSSLVVRPARRGERQVDLVGRVPVVRVVHAGTQQEQPERGGWAVRLTVRRAVTRPGQRRVGVPVEETRTRRPGDVGRRLRPRGARRGLRERGRRRVGQRAPGSLERRGQVGQDREIHGRRHVGRRGDVLSAEQRQPVGLRGQTRPPRAVAASSLSTPGSPPHRPPSVGLGPGIARDETSRRGRTPVTLADHPRPHVLPRPPVAAPAVQGEVRPRLPAPPRAPLTVARPGRRP